MLHRFAIGSKRSTGTVLLLPFIQSGIDKKKQKRLIAVASEGTRGRGTRGRVPYPIQRCPDRRL